MLILIFGLYEEHLFEGCSFEGGGGGRWLIRRFLVNLINQFCKVLSFAPRYRVHDPFDKQFS